MKKKTLYVSDMDGTLLNNGSFVSPVSADIISDLTADGALITVATARTPATVVPLMRESVTSVPYIVMTGAATFDPGTMHYDAVRQIPARDASAALDIFCSGGVDPFVYYFSADGILTVSHDRQMTLQEREFYSVRANLPLKRFIFEPARSVTGDVVLFFATGETDKIRKVADQIESAGYFECSCYPDIFTPGVALIEVFARGVNKASAVRGLAEKVGAERIVVFGDNLNDLPMFDVADLAVAVGNAFPRVKAAADMVIGPNYDDSVVRFIKEDFYDNLDNNYQEL